MDPNSINHEADKPTEATPPSVAVPASVAPAPTVPASPVPPLQTQGSSNPLPSPPATMPVSVVSPTIPPAPAPALETNPQPVNTPQPLTAATINVPTPPVVAVSAPSDPLTPVVGNGGIASDSTNPIASSTGGVLPAKKRRLLKPYLAVLAVVIVLGGGSAAAYYGIVVPNKPVNVLRAAFTNSLQEKEVSFNGTIQGGPAHGGGTAYDVSVKGAGDAVSRASDVQLAVTVSGVSFTVEARLVDQNLYLKVGDLSTLAGLLGTYSPELSSVAKSLNSDVSNQWIEVDSTLLKQAGESCFLNTNWSLTKADVQLLENEYKQHPFAMIQSTSNDTVNGQKTEKFVLSIDDNKVVTYANNLQGLSLVKKLNACQPSSKSTDDAMSTVIGDDDQTPLTIWVNKADKQIVQIASHSTAQDADKDNISASGTVELSYGNVSVTAPSGAKPALQVLSELETSMGASNSNLLESFDGAGIGNSAAALFK